MRWVPAAMVVLIAACAETTAPTPSAASAPPAPLPAAPRPMTAAPSASGLTPAQQVARMVDRSMGQDSRDAALQAASPGGPPPEGRRNEFDVGAVGSYPSMPGQVSPAFRGP